jgi:hypothetical protein
MKDINKQIVQAKKIAEDTQLELMAYLDEKGDVNRRGVIETDKRAKALEQASINAQLLATNLGKLIED